MTYPFPTEPTYADGVGVPILSCRSLRAGYGRDKLVLFDLNLALPEGRIVGLLGPNGCGKSTLLKLIAGLHNPESGEIEICGIPRSEATNALISYLPERTYFSSSMRVDELIAFFRDFYPDFDEPRARRMMDDLGIDTSAKLKTLSKGNKEKVQLVLVMSRRARMYLLDEPIGGVDPAARDYVLSTIIGNYSPDATVLITTHLIHDIEPVLDTFFFMGYGGNIKLAGEADAVRAAHGKTLDELFREVFQCSKPV